MEELENDDDYNDIVEDMKEEGAKYGTVVQVRAAGAGAAAEALGMLRRARPCWRQRWAMGRGQGCTQGNASRPPSAVLQLPLQALKPAETQYPATLHPLFLPVTLRALLSSSSPDHPFTPATAASFRSTSRGRARRARRPPLAWAAS